MAEKDDYQSGYKAGLQRALALSAGKSSEITPSCVAAGNEALMVLGLREVLETAGDAMKEAIRITLTKEIESLG